MFDIERFVDDCRAALAADRGGVRGMREVVARAVSGPAGLMRAPGEPKRVGGWTAVWACSATDDPCRFARSGEKMPL